VTRGGDVREGRLPRIIFDSNLGEVAVKGRFEAKMIGGGRKTMSTSHPRVGGMELVFLDPGRMAKVEYGRGIARKRRKKR
jgi:hypothetical protein